MKRLAAAVILVLLTGCAGQQDAVADADAALAAGLWPERLASGAVCRVGPDGGPLLADRGIGGTGAPVATPAARKVAERGIGGTGIINSGIVGFITGFASICIDGLEVHYDASAKVEIDGTAASIAALRVGQVVAIRTQAPSGAPSAATIAVRREVIGQIESIELASGALAIAGQAVAVPGTIWGAKRVRLGDWVAVSGMRRADGTIVASRLDSAPAGAFMARGQIVRDGASVRVGNLTLHGPAAAGFAGGQFVTVTGGYTAGRVQANTVTSDVLWQNPTEFFGASVKHLVMQGFVHATGGTVWLNGLRATTAPGVAARAGSDGVAIVTLEHKADGTYTAVGLRYTDYRGPPAKLVHATGGAAQGGVSPARGSRTGESPPAIDAGTGAAIDGQPRSSGTMDNDHPDVPVSRLVPEPAAPPEPGASVAMSDASDLAVTTLAVTSGSPSLEPPGSILEINLAPELTLVPAPLITSIPVSCPIGSAHLAADQWDRQATENKELVACGTGLSPTQNLRRKPLAPTESAAVRTEAPSATGPMLLPPPVQPAAPAARDGARIVNPPPATTERTGSSTNQMISQTTRPTGAAIFTSAKPPGMIGTAAATARRMLANASAASTTITLVTGTIVPTAASGGMVTAVVPRILPSPASTTAKGRRSTATAAGSAPGTAQR